MKWVLGLLITLLIASNIWLAFHLFDAGVTQTYLQDSVQGKKVALGQLVAITNEALRPGATSETVVAAAATAGGNLQTFSNDGYIWVGQVGMRFDAEGKLQSVTEWESGGQ